MNKSQFTLLTLLVAMLLSCSQSKHVEKQWESLFNAKDLTGWQIKITGHHLGENFANTFRVEDNLLKVRYDGYNKFDNQFGHIYTDKDYSHYKLRVEYRFVGEQCPGAPNWAIRNSGAMLHCPAPETMDLNQDFPVSIEAQFLGGDGVDERTTANVCTPGTEIMIDSIQIKEHCRGSRSKTYHGEQWVTVEIEVHGDSLVHHIIEGDTVLTYGKLIFAGGGVTPNPGYQEGTPLNKGRIALQSEGHPIDFRKIEILKLDDK